MPPAQNQEDPVLPKLGLSVCVICKNEADRLTACLEAVRGLADDIVVVDSGSDDNSVAVAESLGARVFFNAWTGYGPQKRFSEDCARHDWVLNLDADEVVTPELVSEIRALMATEPAMPGYRLRILTVYPRKPAPRLWADFNNYVRLYDRRRMRFRDSPVHDTVDTRDQPVGQLKGGVVHFSARSYAHIRHKLDAYTTLQAKTLRKSKVTICLRLPLEYPATFARYFLFRRHFTGGLDGVISSHLAAESRFNRLLKMWKAA